MLSLPKTLIFNQHRWYADTAQAQSLKGISAVKNIDKKWIKGSMMGEKSQKAILSEERKQRIILEMRENLKKRKAQKRARNKPVQKEEDV